ncbi:MAG: nitroreductase family protein [Spirochaetota bacterium]
MEFTHSVIDVIKERISCRTYTGTAIDAAEKNKLEELLKEASCGDFRFELIDIRTSHTNGKIGAYGIIKNARQFITGIVSREADLAEFGAVLETIVLYAENLGLSTVWLGGAFHRKGFADVLSLSPGETVPIVIAVGYGADKPALTDILMRAFVGAAKRKVWETLFFDGSFSSPMKEEKAGEYAEPLEMARIAPSAVNAQPWRIVRDARGYHFFLSRKAGYRERCGYDIQMIDMGISFAHFVITARSLGLNGHIGSEKPAVATDHMEYVRSWLF